MHLASIVTIFVMTKLLNFTFGYGYGPAPDQLKPRIKTDTVGYYNGNRIKYPELHKSSFSRNRMEAITVRNKQNESVSLGSIIRVFGKKHSAGKIGQTFFQGIANRTGLTFGIESSAGRNIGDRRPIRPFQFAQETTKSRKLIEMDTKESDSQSENIGINKETGETGISRIRESGETRISQMRESGETGMSRMKESGETGISQMKESEDAKNESEAGSEMDGTEINEEVDEESVEEKVGKLNLEKGEETALTLELISAVVEGAAAAVSTAAAIIRVDVTAKQGKRLRSGSGGDVLPPSEPVAFVLDTNAPPSKEELAEQAEEEAVATMELLVAVMESAAAAVDVGGALVARDTLQKEITFEKKFIGRVDRAGQDGMRKDIMPVGFQRRLKQLRNAKDFA